MFIQVRGVEREASLGVVPQIAIRVSGCADVNVFDRLGG